MVGTRPEALARATPWTLSPATTTAYSQQWRVVYGARNRRWASSTPSQPLPACTRRRREPTTPPWRSSPRLSATSGRRTERLRGAGDSNGSPAQAAGCVVPVQGRACGPSYLPALLSAGRSGSPGACGQNHPQGSGDRRGLRASLSRRVRSADLGPCLQRYGVSVDFDALRCPCQDRDLGPRRAGPSGVRLPCAAGIDHEFVPGTTHFLQLEEPEQCAAALRRFLGKLGIVKN